MSFAGIFLYADERMRVEVRRNSDAENVKQTIS